MKSFNHLRFRLVEVRKTWKKEEGKKQSFNRPVGTSFIDGIVFGLTLAINVVDEFRKEK